MKFFKSALVALSVVASVVNGAALEKREKPSTKYFRKSLSMPTVVV